MGSYDVAIVGCGIIGASIAFELAQEKLRVVALDRQEPGLEASWAAAGMLSPGPHSSADDLLVPFAKRSLELYPAFVAAIEAASKQKIEYSQRGTLELFFGPHAESNRDRVIHVHNHSDLEAEPISLLAARKLEPSLGQAAKAAALLANEATVEPRSLMGALLSGAKNRGAEIRAGCSVKSFLFEGERCVGVDIGSEKIAARFVVLAAGCYAGQISISSKGLRAPVPTRPVRGQMVALRCEGVNLSHVLRSEKGYLVPRRDGRIVAGSTLEDAGFEKRVTQDGISKILDAACELVPALSAAKTLETWAGLRPGTPDDLPILGSTAFEGLLAATGHYRNGILLAPATARVIKEQILTGRSDPSISRFSPQRFFQDVHDSRLSAGASATT